MRLLKRDNDQMAQRLARAGEEGYNLFFACIIILLIMPPKIYL